MGLRRHVFGVIIVAVWLQGTESFSLRDASNQTVLGNVTLNLPANNISTTIASTTQLSQSNVSVPDNATFELDSRRRIKQFIPNRLFAKRSSMGRTPRDRARFIVGALNRRNCLQRILCGLGTKPQAKSGLINDYMYLMDDLIEDDDVRGRYPQQRRPHFRPAYAEDVEPADDYPMPNDDEELMNDPDFLEFVQMERQKERRKRPRQLNSTERSAKSTMFFRRPPNLFQGPPFPPPPPRRPMNKNQFISKRRVELKNEKDLRKRLGLAVDAGRTLGSRQQCRYLFDECPINDQQVDALVRGLRKLLKNDSMKATTPAPTAAAKEKAKADAPVQAVGAPASKVEIVLNLNQNGLPGGLYPGFGSPLNISYPPQAAPVPYVDQAPSAAPVTTVKPSEDEQLMSFLDGMLNLNPTTEMPLDWLMTSDVIKDMDKLLEQHEQESLGDYLENPLKVIGEETAPKVKDPKPVKLLKKPIVRAPQTAKERESSEESSEAGDILDNVLASMKETLMNLADRNNLTIASDLLPPRSSEEESKEEEEDDLLPPRESEEEDYNPSAHDKDSNEDTEVLLSVKPKKWKKKKQEIPEDDEPEDDVFDDDITPEEISIAKEALKKIKNNKRPDEDVPAEESDDEDIPTDDDVNEDIPGDHVNGEFGGDSGEDDDDEEDDEEENDEPGKKTSKPQKITIIFAPSGKAASNSSTIAITPDEKTNIATLTKALLPSAPAPPPLRPKKPLATTEKPVARTPPPYFREFEKIAELVKDTKIVNMSDFDENSPAHPAFHKPTKIRISTKNRPVDAEDSLEAVSSEEQLSEESVIPYREHSSEEDDGKETRTGFISKPTPDSKTLVAVPYMRQGSDEEQFASFEDHNSNWNYFLGNFYTNVMGIRQADDPMEHLPNIGLFHSDEGDSGEVPQDDISGNATKSDLEEMSFEQYDDNFSHEDGAQEDKQEYSREEAIVAEDEPEDRQDFQFDEVSQNSAPSKKKPPFTAPKLSSSTSSPGRYRVTRRPKPPRLDRQPARPIIVNGNFDGQSDNVQSLYYKPLSKVKPKIRVEGNIGQPIELFTTTTEKSKSTGSTTAKSAGPKPKRRLVYKKPGNRKVKPKKGHGSGRLSPFMSERERGLPIVGLLPHRDDYPQGPLSTFFSSMFRGQKPESSETPLSSESSEGNKSVEKTTRKTKKKQSRPRPQHHERMPPVMYPPPPTGLSGLKNFNWRNLLSKYGNSLYDKAMASYATKEQ